MERTPNERLVRFTGDGRDVRVPSLVVVLVLTLVPAALARAPDEASLVAVLPAWETAYDAADLDQLATLDTAGAVIMPSNGGRVHGHETMNATTRSNGSWRLPEDA